MNRLEELKAHYKYKKANTYRQNGLYVSHITIHDH